MNKEIDDTAKNIANKLTSDKVFKKQAMQFVFEKTVAEMQDDSGAAAFFNDNISVFAKNIAEQLNNELDSKELAMQFVLEELDAARQGDIKDAISFVKNSGFSPSEYIGAMNKTKWSGDGNKLESIQMLMRNFTYRVSNKNLMCKLNIEIVDEIMKSWKLGKYE